MFFGYIVMVLPIIVVISLLIYLPVYAVQKRRFGRQPFLRHLILYTFIGYCLSLVYLTLLWYYPCITFNPDFHLINLSPFIWVREVYAMGPEKMFAQLALNIGMFIPYGLLFPMVFQKSKKLWKTALFVLATTLAIETIQYFTGRSADIDDVIMNFTGGVLGYFFFLLLRLAFGKLKWWKAAVEREGAIA